MCSKEFRIELSTKVYTFLDIIDLLEKDNGCIENEKAIELIKEEFKPIFDEWLDL